MPKTTTKRRTPVSEWKDYFSDLEGTISAAKDVIAEYRAGDGDLLLALRLLDSALVISKGICRAGATHG